MRHHVLKRDHHRCVKCGAEGRYNNRIGGDRYSLEVDHIVEIVDGGAEFDEDNLQTLCRTCHKEKTRQSWKARTSKGRETLLQLPLLQEEP